MIDLNDAPATGPAIRYDLDAIAARLRDTAHAWVPGLFPNGRRQGDEWRLANIGGAAPRNAGSCVIMLAGERAGDWHDFDGGAGGGPFSTLANGTGLSDRPLFAHAADMVGWSAAAPARQDPPPAPKAERDTAREIAFILQHAVPIAGTPAEVYLRGRGLDLPTGADLLFHPDLTHWETRTGFPALVGLVREASGAVVALHRTYLEEGGGAVRKAAVPKPRMMLGRTGGGAVRLAPVGPQGVLGLCEGIETGLAAMTACPGLPVWAALSTAGIEGALLPAEVRRVVIFADHDASGAGMRAAEAAAAKLRLEGHAVCIALPPTAGDDFNGMLLRAGPAAIAALVDAAMRGAAATPEPAPDAQTGRHLPSGFAAPTGHLPALRADEGDLARAVDRAWTVVLASNDPPWLFRFGGLPTWVVPDDEGRPVAAAVTDERLRHMLARLAEWRRLNAKGDLVPAPPPTALVKSLLATPDPGLPVLAGIVGTPVFGRGGALLTEPGYHPDARLLYRPAPGFAVPPVPERPAAGEIAAARALLLDDLLGDFPFVSAAERAHALALLLLGFLRAMVDGPTPLHLIEKPAPGTGATLMVDAIATVLAGAGASVMTEGRDDEEWRKRITAKLRQIPALVLLDNLRLELDSSALAAALTAPFWEDRILGASEMARLPIRCAWIATGNNPAFSNEMARRIVRIRLDARTDRPWRRGGFRHPDLMGWVRANRGRLVAACLTLGRAWIAAGRPRGRQSIGSYEDWARTLGGVLEVAGVEGFLGNLDETMDASDGEGAAWRGFAQAWWDRFGTAGVGITDLYGVAIQIEPPLPLGPGNDRSQRIRLGKALARMRDRVFRIGRRTVRVESAGTYQGAGRWRLVPSEDGGEDGHPTEPRSDAGSVDVGHAVDVGECDGPDIHGRKALGDRGFLDARECRGCFSHAHACAITRTPVRDGSAEHPPHPRHPPGPTGTRVSGGGCAGEGPAAHPPASTGPADPPAWLDGVP